MQRTVTRREFNDWRDFYRAYPFDDLHRYHRPAALIARGQGGGKIDELLDWLQPPVWAEEMSGADLATLRAFGITKG